MIMVTLIALKMDQTNSTMEVKADITDREANQGGREAREKGDREKARELEQGKAEIKRARQTERVREADGEPAREEECCREADREQAE